MLLNEAVSRRLVKLRIIHGMCQGQRITAKIEGTARWGTWAVTSFFT